MKNLTKKTHATHATPNTPNTPRPSPLPHGRSHRIIPPSTSLVSLSPFTPTHISHFPLRFFSFPFPFDLRTYTSYTTTHPMLTPLTHYNFCYHHPFASWHTPLRSCSCSLWSLIQNNTCRDIPIILTSSFNFHHRATPQ
jgi:hypothetical protein